MRNWKVLAVGTAVVGVLGVLIYKIASRHIDDEFADITDEDDYDE